MHVIVMDVIQFFKCLSEQNRLTTIFLIHRAGEACVCEIQQALNLDQPKTSQYLAQLRKCGIVDSERRGKWVYYRLSAKLPQWALRVIEQTIEHNPALFSQALAAFEHIQQDSNGCKNEFNR